MVTVSVNGEKYISCQSVSQDLFIARILTWKYFFSRSITTHLISLIKKYKCYK
jgi:hypothetical protein